MKVIIATHNLHKIEEFQRILQPLGIQAAAASLTEAAETGSTFHENARIKACSACRETGLPAVADDSGICVDALGGAPGIFSARYGGEGLTDADRVQLLLKEMQKVPDEKRGAHFTSAICCVFPNGDEIHAVGDCFGTIGYEVRGSGGFGYDPIFMQGDRSFAEFSSQEKDERSHRGKALREFVTKLERYLAKGKEESNAYK